jgi:ribosome biogenesis GTPase A
LEIGKRKSFIMKGGKVDESRTSLAMIRDWQRGNLLLNV